MFEICSEYSEHFMRNLPAIHQNINFTRKNKTEKVQFICGELKRRYFSRLTST